MNSSKPTFTPKALPPSTNTITLGLGLQHDSGETPLWIAHNILYFPSLSLPVLLSTSEFTKRPILSESVIQELKMIRLSPSCSLLNSPISIFQWLTWGVLVHQLVLGTHPHMVFLESSLVFIFFFYHLYRNARENPDHVMHSFLVHLPDDRLSTSYLTFFDFFDHYFCVCTLHWVIPIS